MKYIQLYEKYKSPKIGDYIIISTDDPTINKKYLFFLKNNIFEIYNITEENNVTYFQAKTDVKSEFGEKFDFLIFEIEYFSPNKKDCEMYLAAKKFNV